MTLGTTRPGEFGRLYTSLIFHHCQRHGLPEADAADRARTEFQPATRQVGWRTAVDTVSVKEPAAGLGISVGAVYIARSRVIARLRELIESLADEPITSPGDSLPPLGRPVSGDSRRSRLRTDAHHRRSR